MIAKTADEVAPWTPVPDAVWLALRAILKPYISVGFTIEGDPVSKDRPRFGAGGHVITPQKTKTAEKRVNDAFHDALPGWEPEADWTFGGLFEFNTASGSTVDLDNTQKLVYDALNTTKAKGKKRRQTGLWLDDIQVGQAHIRLTRGFGPPVTEVLLFRVSDNGTPYTRLCTQCGERFRNQSSKVCYSCRKSRTAVNAVLAIGAAAEVDAELDRLKRRAYQFIVASMIGSNTSPSLKDIAERLGTTEHRARAVITALIADGILARDGRKLRVVKQMGAAA